MHSFLPGREVHVRVWTHLVMISVFSKFCDARRAMFHTSRSNGLHRYGETARILKEMRILTMKRVGGIGFTYQNGHGVREIPMYRTTYTIFVSNNTAR